MSIIQFVLIYSLSSIEYANKEKDRLRIYSVSAFC